jgi:hypothetical protein
MSTVTEVFVPLLLADGVLHIFGVVEPQIDKKLTSDFKFLELNTEIESS